jgi:regulator of sigma E protease
MLLLTILLFILIFGLIIFLHELGHFLVAKREGMTVREFAFGFPPRLLSFVRGGTRFSINLLPIGGFVNILGEEEASSAGGSFTKQSAWSRLRVVLAGVAMNLLLAWLLLTFWLWTAPFSPAVDAIAVASVVKGSVAEQSGIKVNDFIVSGLPAGQVGDSTKFTSDVALHDFTTSHKGQSVNFVVRRNGSALTIPATLGQNDAPLGVSIVDIGKEIPHVTWWHAPWDALVEMWGAIVMTLTFMGHLVGWLFSSIFAFFGGLVSSSIKPPADQSQLLDSVSGPIGIFSFLRQTVTLGAPFVIRLAALLSLAVGIFNLLPIPALDGGRAFFLFFEGIFGKRVVSHQVESWIHAAGFVVLIALIIVITFLDIKKL